MRLLARRLIPLTFAIGVLAPAAAGPTLTAAAANPIVTENQETGTTAWQIGAQPANDTIGQIKGYASATSVSQNQSIKFYVSVYPPQTYSIDFYRIGWYGGLGGRLRLNVPALLGTTQAPCVPNVSTGLTDCGWEPSYTLTVPPDWTSGVYLGLLTNSRGYQNYVIFVVKDGRPAQYLYQSSVATYQAYNDYPNNGLTGKSLYPFNSYGVAVGRTDTRAYKVSFDRPYSGDGAGQFFWWEIQFVRWAERLGYDLTYTTDIDTHENGRALLNSKAFLAVGHDEYWSAQMFNAAEAARDAGVNLAFLGSNEVFWQVRFEPSSSGVPDRVMVCYKDASLDPVQGPTTTVNFRSAPVNRPEQTLVGIQYTSSGNWGQNVGYVVQNSSNWAYAGSGVNDGDSIPGMVGYEMDRLWSNYPGPATSNQTLLSRSPYVNTEGVSDYANSSIYQAPSGAWVFAAGTTVWNLGLDSFNSTLADPRIQQTMANIMNAFTSGAPTAPATVAAAPPDLAPGVGPNPSMAAELTSSQLKLSGD